jgi:hypothetical protein
LAVAGEKVASKRGLVHLVRSVIDPRAAFVPPPEGEGSGVGESQRSMSLESPVEDPLQDAGHQELDRGDVVARGPRPFPVDAPGCLEDKEAGAVDFGAAFRDPGLYGLL